MAYTERMTYPGVLPPVGPEDGGHIHETVREIVGNRNYTRKARMGTGRFPRGDETPPPGGPRRRRKIHRRRRRRG